MSGAIPLGPVSAGTTLLAEVRLAAHSTLAGPRIDKPRSRGFFRLT